MSNPRNDRVALVPDPQLLADLAVIVAWLERHPRRRNTRYGPEKISRADAVRAAVHRLARRIRTRAERRRTRTAAKDDTV